MADLYRAELGPHERRAKGGHGAFREAVRHLRNLYERETRRNPECTVTVTLSLNPAPVGASSSLPTADNERG